MANDGTNGANGDHPAVDVAIAIQPNNAEAVPDLLKQITAGVSALETGGDEARHDLLIKARTLVQSLETPRETMVKHCWAQVRDRTAASHPLLTSPDTDMDPDRLVPWPVFALALILACGNSWPRTATGRKLLLSWPSHSALSPCF